MKNFTLTLFFFSTLFFALATPGEESVYDGAKLSYNVSKDNGVVTINLGLVNPEDFEQIIILRSDDPSKFFRNVKELSPEELKSLQQDNVLEDKYPLPSSVVTYYKVQTTDKSGVQRMYPSVKLATR